MRWMCVVLAGGLSACGAEPCTPRGTYDFFFVRRGGAGQAGTFTLSAGGNATLELEGEPPRTCSFTFESDDRLAPLAACQVAWACREDACTGCSTWGLSLVYRPAADGVLPQGTVTTRDNSVQGAWSAAPVTP